MIDLELLFDSSQSLPEIIYLFNVLEVIEEILKLIVFCLSGLFMAVGGT